MDFLSISYFRYLLPVMAAARLTFEEAFPPTPERDEEENDEVDIPPVNNDIDDIQDNEQIINNINNNNNEVSVTQHKSILYE